MKLSQALGASYDLALNGNTYTISPLRVAHRLQVEKWLMEQRLAAFTGDAQFSLVAMMPDAVRSGAFAELMKSFPSFREALRTEKGRAYVLYCACNCAANGKKIQFDEFIALLDDQDAAVLEYVAYWLGKLDMEVEPDHPLAHSNNSSGAKVA